jgi:hypothetical protein
VIEVTIFQMSLPKALPAMPGTWDIVRVEAAKPKDLPSGNLTLPWKITIFYG